MGSCEQSEPLGKVYVDLTAISAGLSNIEGWYLISDGIRTAGQIKVLVLFMFWIILNLIL